MIILLPELYQTDVDFNHIKTKSIFLPEKSNLLEKSPKLWKVYTDFFLAKKILNKYSDNVKVLTFFKNFHYGESFAFLAKRLIGPGKFVNHVLIKGKIWFLGHIKSRYKLLTIKWATGQVHLVASSVVEKPYHIFFNVDKRLTLNITFIILKFYLELDLCHVSGIKIFKKKPDLDKVDYWQNNNTHLQYAYCKHYATFNLYPKSKQLCIKNQKNNYGDVHPFQLSFKFSVIDNNVMETILMIPGKQNSFSYLNPTNLLYFHSYSIYHFLMVSCLIKVTKLYQIAISATDFNSFIIFDGPGFIFPVITSFNNLIVTSTFQCVMQQFIKNSSKEIKQLSFIAKARENIIHLHVNEKSIFFNFPGDCLSSVCVTHILSGDRDEVNLTILDVFYDNPLNFGCLLWGVVVVEDVNNTFEESKIICEQFTKSSSASKSFYSLNSTLFLIIYNYKVRSTGIYSVFGSISKTRCKPLNLDPCELVYHYCDPIKSAKLYLSSIPRFSNISLSINNFLPVYKQSAVNILFSLTSNSCVVIQIGNKKLKERQLNFGLWLHCFYFPTSCPIHISPKTKDNFISSVQGDLQFAVQNHYFTKAVIFQVSQNKYKASTAKLTKYYFNKTNLNDSIKLYRNISSVDIAFARGSYQWIDIAVENAKNIQHYNTIHFKYELKYFNEFDRIGDYGPALFSNLDIDVNVVKDNTKSSSPDSLEIKADILAGHVLFHPRDKIMQS